MKETVPVDNAYEWAEYFTQHVGHKYGIPEDVMIGYFANAIERAHDARIKSIINEFNELISVQGADGNWNYDEYMRGIYNGMVMMRAVLTNTEPEYRTFVECIVPEKFEEQV